ncbi:hypothetical protein [Comamonas sp. GB3 AK4-5]|uniref:hypothetical protein n=1 Tax=Comamonas sp. GB3 AK4-5 TaxID=3231487 RepID=UPI00351EE2B7
MIPAPLFSIPQLLLLLSPFLAMALGAGLLLHGLLWWSRHRHLTAAQRPRFWRPTTIVLALLVLAGGIWGGVLLWKMQQISHQVELRAHYRQSRQQFVLPQDFQYGELVIPQGSLVNRYDPFDNGEPQRPLGLRGLRTVRFPHPVQVAGVWATAMETGPTRLELARDQSISPVFHFDSKANNGYGAWVKDPKRSHLACKQGEYAWFEVPLIPYDIQEEFGKPGPDGPEARFRPSQWTVTRCESDWGPIEVKPVYTGAGPDDAQPQVWGPLLPDSGD